MTERSKRRLRLYGRWVLAALLVPPSALVGVAGLVRYAWRRARGTHATFGRLPDRSAP